MWREGLRAHDAGANDFCQAVAVLPAARSVSSRRQMKLWSLDGTPRAVFGPGTHAVLCGVPYGVHLARTRAEIYCTASTNTCPHLRGPTGPVWMAVAHARGSTSSAARRSRVKVWEVATKGLVSTMDTLSLSRWRWPDGQRVLTAAHKTAARGAVLAPRGTSSIFTDCTRTRCPVALPDNQHALSGSRHRQALQRQRRRRAAQVHAPHRGEPLRCCPMASASSAAGPTTLPASCTTASPRNRFLNNIDPSLISPA